MLDAHFNLALHRVVIRWGYGSIERAEELRERIKEGDVLQIMPSESKAKKLLKDNGGWVGSMSEHLGQVGEVVEFRAKGVSLKVNDQKWFWPFTCVAAAPEGVKLAQANTKKGMVLRVIHDAETAETACGSSWAGDTLFQRLGTLGVVDEVDDNRALLEHSDGNKTWWPLSALESPSNMSDRIKKGDKVKVITSVKQAKKRMKGNGSWVPPMQSYLGQIGKVDKKTQRGITVTYTDGDHWFWCWSCIEAKADKGEALTVKSSGDVTDEVSSSASADSDSDASSAKEDSSEESDGGDDDSDSDDDGSGSGDLMEALSKLMDGLKDIKGK